MRKNAALILLVAAIFSFSCKKDKPGTPPTRSIPVEMKAYWNFKPGSYWVYIDSATGVIDSVYVTNYQNYMGRGVLDHGTDSVIYEELEVEMHHSLDGYDYNYSINTQDAIIGIENGNEVWCSRTNGDTHPCFVYPLYKGNWDGLGYGAVIDSCIITNIFSKDKIFSNVLQFDNTHNSFERYKLSKTFFAKNIGIIRYEVPFYNKTDTLIAYHIQN